MSNVYFFPIDSYQNTKKIITTSRKLLEHVITTENLKLSSYIPLKVHFGEKKNQSYIQSDNYSGIIEFLVSKDIKTAYIETNALYSGERQNRTTHINLAKSHGFSQLPIVIADGEYGDEFVLGEAGM